jgi:hypothetical protein
MLNRHPKADAVKALSQALTGSTSRDAVVTLGGQQFALLAAAGQQNGSAVVTGFFEERSEWNSNISSFVPNA